MEISKVSCLPIYDRLFGPDAKSKDFTLLNSSEVDCKADVSQLPVDFAIESAPRTGLDVAKAIGAMALKMILFPWALYELTKYTVQRLIMAALYPGQSRIITFFLGLAIPAASSRGIDLERANVAKVLQNGGYVRHVVLEKNGVRYSGLMMGHHNTIHNGNWVIQATGNLEFIEHSAVGMAATYQGYGYNTLMINGPAMGRSQGHATPDSIADAQVVGIEFLETAVRARKLVLAGRSLGGAAIGQAILKHHFKKDVDYLVVRQMTFDRVSNICAEHVGILGRLARRLVEWTGLEMDSVAASRRLQELGIREVIVQASTRPLKAGTVPAEADFTGDGPIPASGSLGYHLVKEGVTDQKVFYCLPNADHMTHAAVEAAAADIRNLGNGRPKVVC